MYLYRCFSNDGNKRISILCNDYQESSSWISLEWINGEMNIYMQHLFNHNKRLKISNLVQGVGDQPNYWTDEFESRSMDDFYQLNFGNRPFQIQYFLWHHLLNIVSSILLSKRPKSTCEFLFITLCRLGSHQRNMILGANKSELRQHVLLYSGINVVGIQHTHIYNDVHAKAI